MPGNKIGSCLLMFACVLVAVSCKKKKGLDLSTIKVATVNYHDGNGQGYNYRLTYDGYGNVDSIIGTGTGTSAGSSSLAAFTYLGSSFRITDAAGESYFVDAATNGLILEVQKYDTLIMIYTGKEIGRVDYKTPGSTPPYYVINSINYEWANGDIGSYGATGGAEASYSYNNSRSGQVGDALRITDFLAYGRPYKITAHLPVQLSYPNGGEQYFYTFDGAGRISTFTKVVTGSGAPNDTSEYAYTYY